MRLIWKKYDSEFNPVVTLVGLGSLLGGVYGVALLSHALRHPLVWIVAAIPVLTGVIGIVTLVREYQLWKMRSLSRKRNSYGVPYNCRYRLAFRMMACTYSLVSVNGIDSTNSCTSRYLP